MEIATMVWSQRLLSLLSHGGTTEQEQGHADCLFRRYEQEWWWLIRNEDGERAHPMEIKSGEVGPCMYIQGNTNGTL